MSRSQAGWLEGPRIWAVFSVALVGVAAAPLVLGGVGDETLGQVIRFTARTSLVLFLGAFGASALRRRWQHPASAWLLRNRRYVGLSFATSHYLHMAGILTFAVRSPEFRGDVDWLTIIVGGVIGYGFITAMAATSNDAAIRALGRERWRLLHRTGSYLLWFLFFQSYAGRLAMGQIASAVPTFALLGVLALRWAPVARAERAAA